LKFSQRTLFYGLSFVFSTAHPPHFIRQRSSVLQCLQHCLLYFELVLTSDLAAIYHP